MLVPVTPSVADLWSTEKFLRNRKSEKVRLVWNMVRPYLRNEPKFMAEWEQKLDEKFLKTKLEFRIAYRQALTKGLSVVEASAGKAKKEVTDLVDELERDHLL